MHNSDNSAEDRKKSLGTVKLKNNPTPSDPPALTQIDLRFSLFRTLIQARYLHHDAFEKRHEKIVDSVKRLSNPDSLQKHLLHFAKGFFEKMWNSFTFNTLPVEAA